MIEVQYKTEKAYSFHAFSLTELRKEIKNAMQGETKSFSEIITISEKSMRQKEISEKLGVSARYLRYIKTGKRLSGEMKSKKDKSIRTKILNLAKNLGISSGGGYKDGQLRAANYLDFICEKDAEIVKDMHTIYYEHSAMSIKNLNYTGLFQWLTGRMHEAIESMCIDGSYCEEVIMYRRGNKHPKKNIFCEECGEKLITIDNKKLIYTVVMTK